MKLIKKKCPSCGAGLKFGQDETEIVCEYCNTHFTIQKETSETSTSTKKRISEEEFALIEDVFSQFNKIGKTSNKVAKVIGMVFVIIWIAVVIFIVSNIVGSSRVHSSFDNNPFDDIPLVQKEKKTNYVTEIKQIDEKSLEIFHTETKKSLERNTEYIWSDVKKSEWTYAGMYLLVNKDENAGEYSKNELYDVFKKTFVGKNINMEVYATVKYTSLKLTDDNIVSNSFKGFSYAPMTFINGGTSSFVMGYEGNEDLYNKVIRSKSGEYNILSTEGMYMEN